MKNRRISSAAALTLASALTFSAAPETQSRAQAQAPITSAKVEIVPLELRSPERYQVPLVLEPIRHVAVAAPFDGILRSQEGGVGFTIKEHQELAQFDRTEAAAKLKIAQAVLKEAKAVLGPTPTAPSQVQAEARAEAAAARVELAQLELDTARSAPPSPAACSRPRRARGSSSRRERSSPTSPTCRASASSCRWSAAGRASARR